MGILPVSTALATQNSHVFGNALNHKITSDKPLGLKKGNFMEPHIPLV